jgi:hypothetical protein
MNFEDFKNIVKGFKVAFNRTYDEQELMFMYRYFKDYGKDVFIEAVDRMIQSFDKMPSLKQMIDTCEQARISVNFRKEYEALPPITDEDRKEFQEILDSFK